MLIKIQYGVSSEILMLIGSYALDSSKKTVLKELSDQSIHCLQFLGIFSMHNSMVKLHVQNFRAITITYSGVLMFRFFYRNIYAGWEIQNKDSLDLKLPMHL